MKFTDLYNYVFKDKAVIQPDRRLTTDEGRAAFVAKKHAILKKEFEFLNLDNKENDLRKSFLDFLCAMQTQETGVLKEILYGAEFSELTDE